MLDRRSFIIHTSLVAGGLAVSPASLFAKGANYETRRPAMAQRKFTSPAIESEIVRVKADIADPELAWLFENCFPNTLDTTITHHGEVNGKADTFVITGDIDAMWLRDSSAQIYPYLPYVNDDPALKKLVQGVINRHARSVLIDPYANAFNYDNTKKSE
ncbi:MAG: glycoside hydrolase family 125 protein, partial [Bacteroidetes bacterium]|nr:glycoside hydrolase family 125 protein [Bacteroidota bacterium]